MRILPSTLVLSGLGEEWEKESEGGRGKEEVGERGGRRERKGDRRRRGWGGRKRNDEYIAEVYYHLDCLWRCITLTQQ